MRALVASVLAGSDVSRTTGALRVRRTLAVLFAGYGSLLAALSVWHGSSPTLGQIAIVLVGLSILGDFSARFIRDWGLVVAGFLAYSLSAQYAQRIDLPVHYTPQIEAEKLLALGNVPTIWLQERLYDGATGALEVFAIAMYASHLVVPLLLGVYFWFRRLNRAFFELATALIATSVLASVAFVLAPTAPPWLAAQTGALPEVHHILRLGLFDLGLEPLGSLIGDPDRYNVVAAFPSLHAAFPVVSIAIAVRYGMSRRLVALLGFQAAAVFFSIVYTGDHYVVDILAGAAFALVATAVVARALRAAAPLDAQEGKEP